MELDTYYITTNSEFDKCYGKFESTARQNTSQNIFCIGLDLEYIAKADYLLLPNQQKWVNNINDIIPCILQLCTDACCLVINLKELGLPLPKKLVNILTNEAWMKMGVGISLDLSYLSNSFNLGNCSGQIDILNFAYLANVQKPNLANLYYFFTGDNTLIKEKTGAHNWAAPLTKNLIKYCVIDGYMSYIIGIRLSELFVKRLRSNKVEINIINVDEQKKENYVGRLNEYAQGIKVPFPKYEHTLVKGTYPQKQKYICSWIEQCSKTFEGIDVNKQIAKNEAAKLMMQYIISLE